MALDKVQFIHCPHTSRLSQAMKKTKSWPAGYIHFNIRLEEVGRGEQRDFIRANGDLHSGPKCRRKYEFF